MIQFIVLMGPIFLLEWAQDKIRDRKSITIVQVNMFQFYGKTSEEKRVVAIVKYLVNGIYKKMSPVFSNMKDI